MQVQGTANTPAARFLILHGFDSNVNGYGGFYESFTDSDQCKVYTFQSGGVQSARLCGKVRTADRIAEYTINQTMDDILSDIYRKKPDILCLSCYLWNILYVEQLITEIHKVLPKMQIWLGGPEVSYNAVSVMEQYPQVTGVMCGEGEETFLELMEYWNQERESLDTIKGIVYRENGTCRQNPPRPVMDLSKVPFVYDHIEDFQNKIIYYESSRGCPFSCSYCLSSIDKCLRFRNLELVKKELQFFIDNEVPQVKFETAPSIVSTVIPWQSGHT